ncbi:bifunctional phosphoribosyl-AMP cyclohydrolase/phosphoribosyl-ATP diphosphatase HisIE [Flavilitoribacter nigricans]|uniref:Histidine biosynthesis bifunctional protein HisIE n=1 Tax=Flavilitoribacter nigricans (strain ATCC 23147 / DSM 23189 / NBRC 102662 / NCIMB 1420 / SS-2) TaxID=1122177 RepID=A0A2D0N3Y4_FLAN2|nr:bifunctional phosphoribosyl-AMP cyclohydrolase/phosphoribosyl-ATP diphosphatase HisIE [Flavilitoribacter nigricans]PHN03086.1 bifunctional phosphoribosyl-AMP cyclohydrolase/phosphoribosyl-ATP diphosphatase [Flavilitoribacter nigricans DSM 23189 = NBRC 102662]
MNIDFTKGDGLVPAIIQDAETNIVLMLGYMNEAALEKTRSEGRVTFYSRSKQRLWTKGETSGNFLNLVDIKVDCDQDTLLVRVHPVGPACHTGSDTCFNETNQADNFLAHLENVIQDRKDNPSEKSYTTSLFQKGINKIAQKVGEEAVELVIEAKDNDKDLFLNEAADLTYHLLVLLVEKGYRWEEVLAILRRRHQ